MEQASTSTTTTTTTTIADAHDDFQNTSRVGRRNALPDILTNQCATTESDLPDKLRALTTKDPLESTPNTLESDSNKNPSSSTSNQSSNN